MIKTRYKIFLFAFVGTCLLLYPFDSHSQISSSKYHIIRNELSNSFNKLNRGKNAKVAFLGGSITYNPGWRDSTSAYIQYMFPNADIEFIAAGIPSMGSTPGAFRLDRDILSKGKIDLLFVEAAVNDPTNGRSDTEQIRAMEGIFRHARKDNPHVDIVTMYFVDPNKMKDYNAGKTPEVIQSHEVAARHYQVSSINLAKEVTDRINAGEFSWEDDFKDLHPSPFGQTIYYNSIRTFLNTVWLPQKEAKSRGKRHPMPAKIDRFCYDRGELVSIDKASISSGWEIIPSWTPKEGESTRKGYVDVPMLCADKPDSELSLEFKGNVVGIAIAAGPDAGMITYSIDGSKYKQIDLFTRWSRQLHLPWYHVLEAELSSKKHRLTIRISENRNPESLGNACRIKHFFINE